MPATEVSLKIIGDWQKNIKQGLDNVLAVSMDVMGRNGDEACKHGLIMMAESARHLTPTAPARRPVIDNPGFRHLLRKSQYKVMRQRGNRMGDYYKFTADRLMQPESGKSLVILFANKKQTIAKIGKNRGLAKRSWFWGLGPLGKAEGSTPIPGASNVYSVLGQKLCGYVKENKLNYITRALPAGWEVAVQVAVENKVMANAVIKLQNEWRSSVNRAGGWYGAPPSEKQLSSFFLRAG